MGTNNQLFEQAVSAYRVRLEAALEQMRSAGDAAAFCEAERLVRALVLELSAAMTQGVLQEISNDDERVRGAFAWVRGRAASRGIAVRSEGRRRTLVRTVGGQEVEVETPYAIGQPRGSGAKTKERGAQGTGVYPVLDQLGILGRSTPALRLLVSRALCEASSVAAARELLAASGVEVDHKGALRLTYLVTDDALRARAADVASMKAGVDGGAFAGRRVVATIDGGRLQTRRRVAGRPKKGGRKRFVTDWREPKVLTLYVLGDDGRRDRTISSVIDGTLGDADAAYDLLLYHLRRVGAHRATELILVADGAKWIWTRSDELREALKLPKERFHEVVDYFHAVERLGEFSKTQGWTEDYRIGWVATQKKQLKAGNVEGLEAVFKQIARRDPKGVAKELPYWRRNRQRLRYAAFRDRNMPIGSGAVESSVRRVVNLRLKGASVFWTEEHAEGILHLRAYAKSGRWTELEASVLRVTGWRPSARLRTRASGTDQEAA